MTLSASRRSELRAEAHTLNPVVIVGDKGLTEEVVKEIDRSLKAHELIKVRAAAGDRKARAEWMTAICAQLGAEPVQEIGKVLVIYRKNPEARSEKKEPRKAASLRADSRPSEKPRGNHKLRGTDKPRGSGLRESEKPRGKTRAPRASGPAPTGSERPRSRTPSPRPESAPQRRRPRTSR